MILVGLKFTAVDVALAAPGVPVCPVTAIFPLDDLPEKSKVYIEINKSYVDGGKFQPEKYQKASS